MTKEVDLLPKKILSAYTRRVIRERDRVMRTGTPGAVHDLRVATRRLQEALDFFEPGLPAVAVGRLRKRAGQIRRSLGHTRNCDVLLDLVHDLRSRLQPAERKTLKGAIRHFRAEASRLRHPRGSLCRIDVPGVAGRVRSLEPHLNPLDTFQVAPRATEVLKERLAEIRKTLPQARKGGAAPLHTLRIAIKRLRYTLELLERAGIGATVPVIVRLRTLQTKLGELHDLDVLIGMFGVEGEPADEVGGRRLLPYLERSRKAQVKKVLKAINGFSPEAAAEGLMKELREESA